VSRAAGFHDDSGRRLIGHERGDLGPRQSMVCGNVAGAVGNSHFKNGFCEVDSDGCILHVGFLLFYLVITHRDDFGTLMPSSHQEESISSSARNYGNIYARSHPACEAGNPLALGCPHQTPGVQPKTYG